MADWRDIWRAGNAISGGFGLWGHEITRGPDASAAVKVWVDELRKKGYSDEDIVLYGDSTDGRHIADGMYGEASAKMRERLRAWSEDAKAAHRRARYYAAREEVAEAFVKYLGASPAAPTPARDWAEYGTGGGCMAMERTEPDGSYYLITDWDGPELPTPGKAAVIGYYGSGGEQVWARRIPRYTTPQETFAERERLADVTGDAGGE